ATLLMAHLTLTFCAAAESAPSQLALPLPLAPSLDLTLALDPTLATKLYCSST
ncbi:hypothetical protein AWZ03_015216, partial [Drosophila navojoa]